METMKEAVRMGALIEIVLSGDGFTGGGPKVVNAENPVMDFGPQKLADIRALGRRSTIICLDLRRVVRQGASPQTVPAQSGR
jgi:hypothetical protein